MTKKQLALEIIERLRTAYPDADCTLIMTTVRRGSFW